MRTRAAGLREPENASRDIPMPLRLHGEGRLELDRLITRRYPLDDVNQGHRDQAAGETVRGLLDHSLA